MSLRLENPSGFAELVGSIYEAGMKPERWRPVLERATAQFGSAVGMLWTHDFSTHAIYEPNAQLSCMVGLDEAGVAQFKSYYYSRNVWAPRSKFVQEGGTVLSAQLYPESELPRTEFYADWLRPLDLHHAIGSAVLKEETRDVKLSFVRPRRAGAFSDEERRRMAMLLPHVRNAFLLHRRLGNVQALAASACAALDKLSFGVVLLTPQQRVLHANVAARKLAARTRAISLSEPIGCGTPSQSIALRKLVQDSALTGAGHLVRAGGAMKLKGVGGEMHVVVSPLADSGHAITESAAAVLFCTVPGQPAGDLVRILRSIHYLTPAEASLAAGLMEGLSIQEIALARGITLNTARTQLKSLCTKTGARRQAELVSLFARSIPPVALE